MNIGYVGVEQNLPMLAAANSHTLNPYLYVLEGMAGYMGYLLSGQGFFFFKSKRTLKKLNKKISKISIEYPKYSTIQKYVKKLPQTKKMLSS